MRSSQLARFALAAFVAASLAGCSTAAAASAVGGSPSATPGSPAAAASLAAAARPASSRPRADLTADAVRAIRAAGFHYDSTVDDAEAVDGDGPPYVLDHKFVSDETGATITVQVKTDVTREDAESAGARPLDDVATAIGSTWVGLLAPITVGPNQGENGAVVEMSDGAVWFVGTGASPAEVTAFTEGFFTGLD